MAGIGLKDALNSFQQGVAWKQHQEEIGRQRAQRQALDDANRASTEVIESSKAEWATNGAQGQYRPSEETMFRAAEARGAALARAGMWDQFMQNEAQVAPMRLRARASALQRYEQDGDADALARAVYPTLFDGKRIVGSETIAGAGSVPAMLKLKLSDGSEQMLGADDLVKRVKLSLVDPVQAAKTEALVNQKRLEAQIEAEKQITVEKAKRGFQADVEDRKHQNAVKLEGVKAENARGLADLNNAASQRRTETSAGATLGAARIGANSRITAAGISANAKAKGEGGDDGKKDHLLDQIHDELIRGFGAVPMGSLSGAKVGDELTFRAAMFARDLISKEGVSRTEALRRAAAEVKKRRQALEATAE
jgi:hypothetical protein